MVAGIRGQGEGLSGGIGQVRFSGAVEGREILEGWIVDQKGSDFFNGSGTGSDKTLEEFLSRSPGGGGEPRGGILGPFSLGIDLLMRVNPITVPGFFNPPFGGPTSRDFEEEQQLHAMELGLGDSVVEADLGMGLFEGIGVEVGR